MSRANLKSIVGELEAHYGRPKPPATTDPFEMILLENIAYLVSDEQREKAFSLLRSKVGTEPPAILTASHDRLLEVTKLGGMHPEARVQRLRDIAQICLQEFNGDLAGVLKLPLPKARRALMKFPSIGEPGAEKILMFTESYPVLALDSNGLRVLLRIGFGEEQKSYSSSYASVRDAVKDQLSTDYRWLGHAHLLLRQHGRELCRNSQPLCKSCPLRKVCRYYLDGEKKIGRQARDVS